MQGTLTCPRCNTSNIALGAAGCPSCGVPFATAQATAAPVYTPVGGAPAVDPTDGAPQAIVYATLGQRFVAGVLDALIVNIPIIIIFGTGSSSAKSNRVSFEFNTTNAISLIVGAIYTVAMTASANRATLGMKVMKLRVVRDGTLEQLTLGRAFGRWAVSIVSATILMIGYIMIGFTKKRQALHDKLADTIVVRDPG